ncbi:MAG: hypothetical protein ACYCSO_05155 [Cuniculiplasma sp.]
MGKFSDLVLGIIILIIGMYILTKLGMTWPSIWHMFKTFFSGSSPPTNTTGSVITFGMAMSNSHFREKIKERKEMLIRLAKAEQLKNIVRRRVKR